MVKKFSMLALAGLIALPVAAGAAGKASTQTDLERKIQELSMQLDQLKAQMADNGDLEDLKESVSDLEDRSEAWDLAARFKFYGDFRSRIDSYGLERVSGAKAHNSSIWTNRFRLNMRVKATENVEFKGRLAMYKAWGTPTTVRGAGQNGLGQVFPMWDGNSTRNPSDNALRVDRAFVNWNNIGGAPVWFSIGRRPTTDGPPSQIRMGADSRLATPVAYMDWPFDGISMGYAYRWGSEAMGTGRVRFCYGRGFEDGLEEDNANMYNDMDFAGFSWDVMKKGDRFLNLQSFMAFNVFNYPDFEDPVINQMAALPVDQGGFGMDRMQLGNILHTSGVYQDKVGDFNFFVVGGWSQTMPNENGMFNDMIGMGAVGAGMMTPAQASMMGLEATPNTDNENGYSVFIGGRYDIDSIGLKLGLEYNYGSEYWISMSPGHDDLYQSKLSTRGSVYEVYGIYDLPTGDAISKYAKTFIRFGWQHYEYDYSGSMDWNVRPYDLGDSTIMGMAQAGGMDFVESADQVYLTFEAYF